MCDPFNKTFALLNFAGIWLCVALSLTTMILVTTDDCDLMSDLVKLAGGGYKDDLAKIIDLSREPRPNEVCTNDPNSGDPCNGLARNDECTIGQLNLLRDDHCNNCCDRLILPDSCTETTCKCYSNSGCIQS